MIPQLKLVLAFLCCLNSVTAAGQEAPIVAVRSIAFSADGKLLAVAGSAKLTHGILRVINLQTNQVVFEKQNVESGFVAVDFAPNGLLAVGQFAKVGLIIDVSQQKVVHELKGHENHVRCVRFNSDGKTLYTGSYDRTVKVWDVTTGKLEHTITGHPEAIYSLALTSDDSKLAVAIARGDLVWLWDLKTPDKPLVRYKKFGSLVPCIAISPDDRWLAAASWDGTSPIFRLNDASRTSGIDFRPYGAESVCFSNNREWYVVGGRSVLLQQIKFPPDTELDKQIAASFEQLDSEDYESRVAAMHEIRQLGMRAGAKLLASLDSNSAEVRWRSRKILSHLVSMKSVKRLATHKGERIQVAFSKDDRLLASGDSLGELKLWNTSTWQEENSYQLRWAESE